MPIVEIYGQQIEFPDDMSEEQLNQAVSSAAAQLKPAEQAPAKPKAAVVRRQPAVDVNRVMFDDFMARQEAYRKGKNDLFAGALRGAGSIGATLLSPLDYLRGKDNEQRRVNIDKGLAAAGADPESWQYGLGKVASEVAGTLGVGPALGGGLLAVAPRAAPLATAISSGGFTAGKAASPAANLATRMLGGAITGGASAGLVNPAEADTGAMIGGGLPLVSDAARVGARKIGGAASHLLGMTTGSGSESVRQAALAGMEGGERARSFTANLRGEAPMTDALDIAKANLDAMRAAKNAQYRSGMIDITSDKSVIDFADVDNALNDAAKVTLYKGQVKNAKAEKVRSEIEAAVNEWKNLDPADYHTPEGFDALKQRIGAIIESIPMEERTAQKVGKDLYNSVKGTISKQAPTYAKVMDDYAQASDDIAQAEKALSLGKKASVDTAMRKLQSLTRNNASTNYGNRLAIAEQLQQSGGQDFMPALAGQSLSSITPRGLQSVVASGAGAAGYLSGGIPGAAAAIPLLAAQSPRLVGEAAYGAGKTARIGGSIFDQLIKSRTAPVASVSILDYLANQ